MEDEAILKIEHVSKEYMLGVVSGTTLKEEIQRRRKKLANGETANKRFTALDDVNLVIRKGEAIGLIGHNGAGKSTLLKLISRITAPTKGKIYIGGRVASLLEVGTGFHPELTGRQNIYLNGSILGMSREEIDKKMASIIEFSECAAFIDTPVKRYSSGMYVKLAFSVAAHLDAEIMIMDEVLAVGDMRFQTKCLNKIKELIASENRTVIYVSHYMESVKKLCNRCVVLEHGRIAFDGDCARGISMYLGNQTGEENHINLTNSMRADYAETEFVQLTEAEYLNKSDCIFMEPFVDLRLQWINKLDIQGIGLYFCLCNQENVVLASGISGPVHSGEKGKTGQVHFIIDISNINDGKYTTHYELYCIDENGNWHTLDSVTGMNLIVERLPHDSSLVDISGFMKLPITVKSSSTL